MSLPTTAIFLNRTTPAAPSGQQNVAFASDNATPQQSITASDPVMVGDSGSGGLAGNVPAPAAGDAAIGKFLKADGIWTTPPMVIGFMLPTGTAVPANTITPPGRLIASRTGVITRCKAVVNASDPSTPLVFRIMQNGVNIFSFNPGFAASTASGTIGTFLSFTSSPNPLPVNEDDIFTIDILTGSTLWSFTVQLEA